MNSDFHKPSKLLTYCITTRWVIPLFHFCDTFFFMTLGNAASVVSNLDTWLFTVAFQLTINDASGISDYYRRVSFQRLLQNLKWRMTILCNAWILTWQEAELNDLRRTIEILRQQGHAQFNLASHRPPLATSTPSKDSSGSSCGGTGKWPYNNPRALSRSQKLVAALGNATLRHVVNGTISTCNRKYSITVCFRNKCHRNTWICSLW